MKRTLYLMAALLILIQVGCVPKKEDKVREHLMAGSWDLTNHCDNVGYITFRSGETGTLVVNDECLVGYPCSHSIPFDWTLDEESGLLRVMYDAGGSAMMICSSIEHTAPPSETEVITENTQLIYFYGYTFER